MALAGGVSTCCTMGLERGFSTEAGAADSARAAVGVGMEVAAGVEEESREPTLSVRLITGPLYGSLSTLRATCWSRLARRAYRYSPLGAMLT